MRVLNHLGYAAWLQGDGARAPACYRESLDLQAQLDAPNQIAECLEGIAAVLAERGRARAAARLLGAVEAHREAGYVRLRYERHTRRAASVRAQLGEAAWAAAWEAGRHLSWEQAVDEALAGG
jgi:non-specific serine/threonine protein kinase